MLLSKRAAITAICCACWLLGFPRSFLAVASKSSAKTAAKQGLVRSQHRHGTAKAATRKTIQSRHVVKSGDTLYSIARAHSTSVRSVMAMNGLKSNRLRIGQTLILNSFESSNEKIRRGLTAKAILPEWKNKDAANPFSKVAAKPTFSASEVLTPQPPESLDGQEDDPADKYVPSASILRFKLVTAGLDLLGVRYRWRGISERTGFDCSGLVKWLFDQFGINLPHSAREQFKLGVEVSPDELQVGDLVFFSTRSKIPTHVGIYIGENCILHALSGARKVIVSHLEQNWYKRRFLGARRIQDLWNSNPVLVETSVDSDSTN
jgi:peptidoglycan endopeptidase LytE